MTVIGPTIRHRRTLWERAQGIHFSTCEICVFIGGAVLVGLLGAASGAGMML